MTSVPSYDSQPWPCHDLAMPIDIGGVRGTTRSVGADNIVFASPVPFAVGSAISFVLSAPEEIRFECSGIVTNDHESPGGGFEIAATIASIRIAPLQGPRDNCK